MQPTQIQSPVSEHPAAPVRYAGFWRRFVAYFIDQILMSIVAIVLFIPALALLGIGIGAGVMDESPSGMGIILAAIAAYLTAILAIIVLEWLYFALMESSIRQATLGKMALGIVVTDMDGRRITFGRATGRYFGKILSGLTLSIGYIMAGFTQKKQALHDLIASCLVVLR